MNGASPRIPTVRLVARREITERLRGRPFWVMTALMVLLIVGLIVIPALVRRPPKPTVVGLVGAPAQALGPALQATAAAAQVPITVVDVADYATANAAVEAGTLDVALRVDPGAATAVVKESLSPAVQALLQAVVNEAHQMAVFGAAGVPASTVRAAMQPVPFMTTALEPVPADLAARVVAAIATSLLLYVSLAVYGVAVATGVAQEKTSRTAEVLLAAVRPSQLMAGKILGIGACGLGQLTVAAVAGLVANAVVPSATIPTVVWSLLPMMLLWFLLGYALYASAYAAAGALVARQEDVQSAVWPLTIPLLGGYLLVYLAAATPDAWWVRVLSFLPPLSPVLMPARFALGHLAAWEMPLAAVLTAAAAYGMVRLAARIYAANLMRGGARLGWGAALRLRGE